MNKQRKPNGGRGIEWTDYTWNPIGGCFHACAWRMPDGNLANCYAEDVANKFAGTAYADGFEHHYWRPSALKEPSLLKTPSRIFSDSMSDAFGHWVPAEHITQVLDVVAANPQHIFQFLTKNPQRLKFFDFPENAWIGISAPPTHMWNKELSTFQRNSLLRSSLEALHKCNAHVKWMSIEPLSFDIAEEFYKATRLPLNWVVVGAASNGPKIYQPSVEWVDNLLFLMDELNIPVFFKGNLRGNPAATPWREDFPTVR